jgi:hypothetical protein
MAPLEHQLHVSVRRQEPRRPHERQQDERPSLEGGWKRSLSNSEQKVSGSYHVNATILCKNKKWVLATLPTTPQIQLFKPLRDVHQEEHSTYRPLLQDQRSKDRPRI